MTDSIPPIVVMGVQGAGKSTIGGMLAERLGVAFVDGDSLHTDESVALMSAGVALSDEQRIPWLRRVGAVLAERSSGGIVVACSALKRSYRELLRESVPELFIVEPEGSMELVAARIGARRHEYMPAGLLQSQFDTLEPRGPDERGITVDIAEAPADIIDSIARSLASLASTEGPTGAH